MILRQKSYFSVFYRLFIENLFLFIFVLLEIIRKVDTERIHFYNFYKKQYVYIYIFNIFIVSFFFREEENLLIIMNRTKQTTKVN